VEDTEAANVEDNLGDNPGDNGSAECKAELNNDNLDEFWPFFCFILTPFLAS